MKSQICVFSVLILLSIKSFSQTIDGTYSALELIQLKIDTSGTISFYGKSSHGNEKWFYEVTVRIDSNQISIDKSPVVFDKNGRKSYSVSDGGFLSYRGQIVNLGNIYIAVMKLEDCDYIGISPPQPAPKIKGFSNVLTLKDSLDYESFVPKYGSPLWLLKGTVEQDIIIRKGDGGLWLNNNFFFKKKPI